MDITHTWKVTRLIQKNDNSGVVIQVFYKVYSTDGEYSYVSGGNVELNSDNIQDFVSYENLTESIVLNWVKSNLNPLIDNEQINTNWINQSRNPKIPDIKVENLPWQISETPEGILETP